MIFNHHFGMELKHIRGFVEMAMLGNVTTAAEKLHITQPALSRRLQALEEELDVVLFEKFGRGLRLTSEGEALLNQGLELLSSWDSFQEAARSLQSSDTGLLRIGATPQNLENLIADFLIEFGERYPNVEVRLWENGGPDLLQLLERNEIDIALCGFQVGPQFISQPLGIMAILAVTREGALDVRGEFADIEVFHDKPVLLMKRNYATRITFDAACHIAGVRPNMIIESGSPQTLLSLVDKGHGTAIIPSSAVFAQKNFSIHRVRHNQQPLDLTLAVTWNKRITLPVFGQRFISELDDFVKRQKKPFIGMQPRRVA